MTGRIFRAAARSSISVQPKSCRRRALPAEDSGRRGSPQRNALRGGQKEDAQPWQRAAADGGVPGRPEAGRVICKTHGPRKKFRGSFFLRPVCLRYAPPFSLCPRAEFQFAPPILFGLAQKECAAPGVRKRRCPASLCGGCLKSVPIRFGGFHPGALYICK